MSHSANFCAVHQQRNRAGGSANLTTYRSKFRNQVRQELCSAKDSHRTMGYAKTPLRPPQNFLRKHQGIRLRKCTAHKCPKIHCRPAVPTKSELPERQVVSSQKNFRTENIHKVVRSNPKQPVPKYVDTKNGDFHNLSGSGLMPQYRSRPNYGKVPHYIINRLKEAAANEHKKYQRTNESCLRYIPSQEREELLNGLKRNWEYLQGIYQKLPFLTDTLSKKSRKSKLETDLRQLEQDILLLELNENIYIKNK